MVIPCRLRKGVDKITLEKKKVENEDVVVASAVLYREATSLFKIG